MTTNTGYYEAIFEGAAKAGIEEYIAEPIPEGKVTDSWTLIHYFEDDAVAAVLIGLYEHLRDWPARPPALAEFYIIKSSGGLYRLPTPREGEWLYGKTTVSA